VFLGGFADNRLITMAICLFGSGYSAWCESERYHVALTPCRAVGALCAESARSKRLIRMMRSIACAGLVALLSYGAFGQSSEAAPKFEIADVHSSAKTTNAFARPLPRAAGAMK
jgi:hypothetical protein